MEFQFLKFEGYTLIKVLVEKLENQIGLILKSELVLHSGRGEKNIILDLSICNYCDSVGFSAILVANRLCQNSKGTFVLTGVYGQVKQLIKDSQLHTILNITDSLIEAETLIQDLNQVI